MESKTFEDLLIVALFGKSLEEVAKDFLREEKAKAAREESTKGGEPYAICKYS